MLSQWEEFPIGPGDEGGELHVTLSRKGEILIGAAAFEKMGQPEAAILLFDKLNTKIGLLPSDKRVANAYPLKTVTRARHRVVRANRFCRHHGIRVERTVAFNKPIIDQDGMLVLDLVRVSKIGR